MFTQSQLNDFLSRFDQGKHAALVEVYIQSLERHQKACREAQQNKDDVVLKAAVHDIKSLALTIGADTLGELAKNIELHLIEGRAQEAFSNLDGVYPLMDEMLNVLRPRINEA